MSSVTPSQLLESLRRRGLTLTIKGSSLALAGPHEQRTPKIKEYIRANKSSLIVLLQEEEELRTLGATADKAMASAWHQMVKEAYHAASANQFPDEVNVPGPLHNVGRWTSGPNAGLYHISPANQQFVSRYIYLKHVSCDTAKTLPSVRAAEEIIAALTLYWVEKGPLS